MSLATRCPSCLTVFRVVQDQLRVSEGWVRCGRCAEVFNALEHMVEVARPAAPADGPPALAPSPAAAPTPAHALAPPQPETPDLSDEPLPPPMQEAELYDPAVHGGYELDDGTQQHLQEEAFDAPIEVSAAQHSNADAPPGEPDTVPAGAADVVDEPHEPLELRAQPAVEVDALLAMRPGEKAAASTWAQRREAWQAADADDVAEPSVAPTLPEPIATQPTPDVELDDARTAAATAAPDGEAAMPSFLRQAERAARWQRPLVRRLLGCVVFVATLGLATQVAVTYRDLIAARWQASRALLEPLCQALGCVIEEPRWLEAVVVESTGLTRLDGNTYRLQVSLRNRSAMVLALPAIDLMLTDSQGRLVARRALSAGELGAGVKALAAHAELPLQAMMALGEKGSPAVSGYTIEIFYP